jgi:biopolymer transport protein ExbD
MANDKADGKQRLLDVWILEINTVYREVPFVVVTDWLQQGRLLREDCVRRAGSKQWHAIDKVPALGPYLPRAEPQRAEDRAEALEPVELGLDWRRPGEEEDEDVDMIPLIDISLVLLIFFMMTASVAPGMLSMIATPSAQYQTAAITHDTYWVGVDTRSRSGRFEKDEAGRPLPWYSFGKDSKELLAPSTEMTPALDALAKDLSDSAPGEVKIRLRVEKTMPIETVKDVTQQLQQVNERLNRARGASKGRLTFSILGEVSEPKVR